jgi:hypothetical protein
MRTRGTLAVILLLGLCRGASADDVTAATAAAIAEPEDPRADPSADRAWYTSTALTQPRGSFTFNDVSLGDFGLVFLGASYGITDNLQVGAMVLPPVADGVPFVGVLNVKMGGPITRDFHVAAVATGFILGEGVEGLPHWAATIGGVGSLCVDHGCGTMVSAFAYLGFMKGQNASTTPLFYGASAVVRVTRRVKLLLEADSATVIGEGEGIDGGLVTYGIRFVGRELAGDIGFAKPFQNDSEDQFILGIPVFTLTYRPN